MGEIGGTMEIDHDDSKPSPRIPRNPEDYNSDSDDKELLPSRK